MPVLYLHIGAGKTGTSALQTAFASNVCALRRQGIVYPPDPANRLAREGKVTSGNGAVLVQYFSQADANDYLEIFKRRLTEFKGLNVLYSSELLQFFDKLKMNVLVEQARSVGFTTKMVYYVRSIAAHEYSVYCQAVKRRKYTGSFRDFIISNIYRNRFSETIKRAESIVSRDDLIVRNYDTAKSDIIRDFTEKVLNIDHSLMDFTTVPRVNRSLSCLETEILRVMNQSFETVYQSTFTSDCFISSDPELRERISISPDELRLLEEKYRNGVAFVNRYIEGEGIDMVDPSHDIGERPTIELTEAERRLINELRQMIPRSARKATGIGQWPPEAIDIVSRLLKRAI